MTGQTPAADPYRSVAERYVKLVLAVGQHDADYVDAFYGPPEWRTQAESAKQPLASIDAQAAATETQLAALPPPVVKGAGCRAVGACAGNTSRASSPRCARASPCCKARASPSTRSRRRSTTRSRR